MKCRRLSPWVCLFVTLGVLAPQEATAQNRLIPAAIGGVIGVGAGGYVALGVVAFRARQGEYLFGLDDMFGWESAPVMAGGALGVALGAWDQARLRNAVFASMAGGLVGTGVGALVGRRVWPPPEGKWAGGVIGGGVGVMLGAGIGGLLPPGWLGGGGDDEDDPGVPVAISITVGP